MSYSYRYQFLTQGRYALVDSFHRNIWLTVNNEGHAHQIRQVFRSKVSSLVFDLSVFENYSPENINSHNCLEWKVPVAAHEELITVNLSRPVFNKTQTAYHRSDLKSLIKQSTNTLLSVDRTHELHDQMLLYSKIIEVFDRGHAIDQTAYDSYLQQINKIFQVELDINVIENELELLTRNYIGSVIVLPGWLLTTIKRPLYE